MATLKKHPIVTIHDIGLNSQDNFYDYFMEDTKDIFDSGFCIYNINIPGQEIPCEEFPENYHFPTMDELVFLIEEVANEYNFKSFIGFGVGAGANLMLRYTIKYPNKLDSMILINCVETKVGWSEWAQEKLNIELLRDFGMTKFTENYLLWHHLGERLWESPKKEVQDFRDYYEIRPNLDNVAAFIDSYLKRTEIDLHKGIKPIPILQIVGERAAFVKDAEYLHSLLDPKYAEIVKFKNCGGNVLKEKPARVTEAILLHLQGVGFVPWLNVHDAVSNIAKNEDTRSQSDEESTQTTPTKPIKKRTLSERFAEIEPKCSRSVISHQDDGIVIIADENDEKGPIAGFYHGAPEVDHHYRHKTIFL